MQTKQIAIIKRISCLAFLFVVALAAFSQSPKVRRKTSIASSKKIDFRKEIKPILEKNCLPCHGAKRAMGQLRLDSKTLAFKGGASGAAIVAGNSKVSLLVQRLQGLGNQARMPLVGDPLSKTQIDLISNWIDQGAIWNDGEEEARHQMIESTPPKHWAYVAPQMANPPHVKNNSWIRNPIDNFVLARLQKEGLQPSPEASKETLIRRVYLDLIGLPPTPKEVDDFIADHSADAYEKVVDRLLASQHYGERWARTWLDLARYADTNGYEKDNRRVMWKYRDWVINAFNNDMPFDQFTIEQIAGDMLPNATLEQRIATGFHRNTLLNQEGGVDPEEARWETIIDRVNTTATVWLGATLGCAQCHNHKYDPFTQKDYYRFFAFFDNSEYKIDGTPLERWTREPTIYLPTPEQEARRNELNAEITKLETVLRTPTPELQKQQAEWERAVIGAADVWTTLEPISFTAESATLTKLPDNSLLASGDLNPNDVYIITAKTNLQNIKAIRIEAMLDESLPRSGPGRDPYGNFALHGFEVQSSPASNPAKKEQVIFSDALADEGIAKNLLRKDNANWGIDATNDAQRLPRQAVFVLQTPIANAEGTLLEIRLKHNHPVLKQTLGRFRLFVTSADNATTIANIGVRMRPVLMIPVEQRNPEQQAKLAQYYLLNSPSLKATRDRLNEAKKSLASLNIATAEVMGERQSFERPFTYLRNRGSFTSPAEKVYAGVPASLHPLPENQMPNRLGLAYWLVDEKNPLVARVTVNRFWEQFFGRGIVETSEDFGTQSMAPSHQDLLDWLATEFMTGAQGGKKWGVKSFHRLIVTSATYRQLSRVTPELAERDPHNRLLARGARFRLEAEMIRDSALAASGLLSHKIGGESVFPIQPDGVWNTPFSGDRWQTSDGEDKFRRAIYTFARRTAPYPMFTTFDAPSRELCTVRRVRTNTPLQALTLLNDEAYFVAARALAKRMMSEGGSDLQSQIVYGFRLCTSRKPNAKETERLVALYQQELGRFQKDTKSAITLLKNESKTLNEKQLAEMAAFSVVANVLLNLDETLTKE